jgi:hypothetical protein
MRYFVQFLVPALIFAGVVYVLMRRRRQDATRSLEEGRPPASDTGPFIAILVVSAAVALGTAFLLQSMWD